MVQLESAAERSGVDFEKIELGTGLAGASGGTPAPGDEQSTGGELAAAPGAVPVAGGAMSAMPFSFTFNGSYFDLSSFMSKLEHFVTVNNERVNVTGRLLRLESVAIVPVRERLPADAGPDRRGHVHRAAGRAGVRRRERRPVGAVRSEQHPGHDQRERRSRTMNVVTSTWHQLVNRRLWPVAVVLLVALVAIPVVLARDPEAAEVPAPAPVGGTNVDDSLATPVVAEAAAEDGDRRRRVLGVRKDPFKPAPVKTPEPTTQQATAPNTGGSPDPGYGMTTIKPPSFPGSSGGSMPSMPSPLPYPIPGPAAPQKKTYPANSVIVRFGDAKSDSLERMLLPKLAPLGGEGEDETPVLIYMGLTKDGKRAKFLVEASVEVDGDGVCKPHPSSCEVVELAVGETEFLDVFDPEAEVAEGEDPEPVAQYQLDLVDIKRKGDADVK